MTARPPAHYLQAVEELVSDPVVKRMAARPAPEDGQCVNGDGTLTYDFMRGVAEEYINAGGQHPGPVGAVAHAVLRLRAELALSEERAPAPAEPEEVDEVEPAEEPAAGIPQDEEAAPAVNSSPSCVHGADCQHQRCEGYGCLESDCCR